MWHPPSKPEAHPAVDIACRRWRELFDPYAPDTFQARLFGSDDLLREVILVAEAIDDAKFVGRALTPLMEELVTTLDREADTFGLPELYRAACARLSTIDITDSEQLARHARVALGHAPDFRQKLLDSIRAELERTALRKERLDKLLSRLATTALNQGRAPFQAFDRLNEMDRHLSVEQFIDRLTSTTDGRVRKYDCLVCVLGPSSDWQSISQPLRWLRPAQKGLVQAVVPEEHRKEPQDQISWVHVGADGPSRFAAAEAAVRSLRGITNTFNFYRTSADLRVGSVVVVRDQSDSPEVVDLSVDFARTLHPRTAARELTRHIVANNAAARDIRILNALELTHTSHSSSEPNLRLVALWSALELLAGTLEGRSARERCTQLVAQTLTMRRVEKISRYIAIGIHESGGGIALASKHDLFRDCTRHFVPVEPIVIALASPKDDPRLVALLDTASHHGLLLYRVWQAWKEFSSPTELLSRIQHSVKTVGWHVNRIYTARNLIAHYGVTHPMTGFLLANLNFYVSTVVARVLHESSQNPTWTLSECVASLNLRYEVLTSLLRDKPNVLRVADVVASPTQMGDQLLWGASLG